MEITIQKIGPCMAKVSIVVSPEQIKEELNKTYRQTADSVSFPGFRKGKAPIKLIEKRFGDLVRKDVKEKLFGKALSEAIEKHNLEPVADPEIDLESIELKEEEPLRLEFEIETKPEFDLGDYKEIEVQLDPIQVTDGEIDERIMEIRSHFAYLKTLEDAPVNKKHYLTVDVVYQIEGEKDIIREKVQANMALGIIDEIEMESKLEEFLGKKPGDQVALEIPSLPEQFLPEEYRGKAAKILATVKEIQEVAFPDLDEDFLKKIQMKNVDELREKIYLEILENKKAKQPEKIERKVMDTLIQRHSFDIPEKLLIRQIANQENNLRYEMMRLGVPPDKVAEEAGKLEEKNREAAERNIRSNFIYDQIAEKEEISVTENEIEQELKIIAKQQHRTVDEIKQQYEEKNLVHDLRNFLRNQKIRQMLRESAKIVEKDAGGEAPEMEASSDAP